MKDVGAKSHPPVAIEGDAPAGAKLAGGGCPPAEIGWRQNQKMEALAQVAGGVAHELNDLLAVITGHASLLLDAEDPAAEMLEPLNQICAAGERAAGLIRQLLIFSCQQPMHLQNLDLNGLIEGTTPGLRRLLGEHITIEPGLAASLPLIRADAGMMEQILMNLALNAREAMPRGGRLIIATEAVTITEAEAKLNPASRPGSFVCLKITDTGCGIAPEVLPRIFEPFFTTKGAGKSTGLGLAMALGIVQQHTGWLVVESAVNAGATFKIFLPAVPTGIVAEPVIRFGERISGGREVILLVEDEVSVREVTVAMLQKDGYRVLQAGSAEEALETWKWHAPRIELLLTDMVLPGHITGPELAERFRAEKPTLKVICLSGYGREDTARFPTLPAGSHFLRKPCRSRVLAKAVRAMLDGKQP
jgi:CheY-like chemotaxis protein